MTTLAKRKAANKSLRRETFSTSRAMDFFSQKELTAQTGHQPDAWPLVALKELMDNALDACEDAGIAPKITVKMTENSIEVTDNGPGIPPETIAKVIDYSVRVSSREAYVAPTRGAQGNALKTVLAMGYTLDGQQGRVEIFSRGIRHEITVRLNPIQQAPIIDHQTRKTNQFVKNGTCLKIAWPNSACSILESANDRFNQIADDFAFLNPHLALECDTPSCIDTARPTNTAWEKWLPSHPTCCHWYTPESFERLISAYLSHDGGREMLVRELVSLFDGLTGSGKQKKVLDATGLARQPLSALMKDDHLDHDKILRLLNAMKRITRPIKPARLGVIGESHLRARFAAAGVEMKSFKYRKVAGIFDCIPWVVEAAFAWNPDGDQQRLITGVNWSPGIINPFRELGSFGKSLDSILERQRAGREEPIVAFLHLALAKAQYTDRGKSAIVIGGHDED